MDVLFELRDRLVGDYGSYAGSFIRIKDARVNEQVKRSLDEGVCSGPTPSYSSILPSRRPRRSTNW